MSVTTKRSSSPSPTRRGSREFSRQTKDFCWNKADPVQGRDARRWRFDVAGNLVCRGLRNCNGPLCVEFDHIRPISRGGKEHVSNCQVLQARANRSKANKFPTPSKAEMVSMSDRAWEDLEDEDLDAIELAVYGDVYRNGKRYRGLPFKHGFKQTKKAYKQAEDPKFCGVM